MQGGYSMIRKQKSHLFLSTITALLLLQQGALYAMADLSFVVIDLKYNREQGVKICEIQPGSLSKFSGADALEEINSIPKKYCDILAQHHLRPGYFTSGLYPPVTQALTDRGWSFVSSWEDLFGKLKSEIPRDPDNLSDYQTCVFSSEPGPIIQGHPTRFPQLLFLDRAILPYCQNKYTMNRLCNHIEEMRKLRPVWRLYKKGYSSTLARRIMAEIPGNLVVIKPIASTMGRGVIILEKKDLLKTLKFIFSTPKNILIRSMERSYSHYALDRSSNFIVEEFIPSDPLYLGEERLPYDCTMRIIAVLSYEQKVAAITFLSEYWYSPRKPIDPAFTLIESHKAKGKHFCKVAPDILEEVKRQLCPALLEAYRYMLDHYDR